MPAADQDLAYVSKSAKIEDIINQASEKKFKSSTKDIFGCDQFGFRNQFAGCDGALMPLVSGIEERHKVERINECNFHCCFGAP